MSGAEIASLPLDRTIQCPSATVFECYQCLRSIETGRPIYMRNDYTFCSKDCRELGVHDLIRYQELRDRVNSVSSMASADSAEPRPPSPQSFSAHIKSILSRVIRTASATSLGSTITRTYSSSVVWGRDFTKNSSLHAFFAYLPDLPQNSQ
jgi:hypothetical protein